MKEETLYWIFSTLPQVIAALTGLVIATTTFIYNSLDDQVQNDSSLEDIIHKAKRNIFTNATILICITIAAIIVDVVLLWQTPWVTTQAHILSASTWQDNIGVLIALVVFILLNTISFLYLIILLRQTLNPDFKRIIVDRFAKEFNDEEKQKLQQASTPELEDKPIEPLVFIDHFMELEHIAREFLPDSGQLTHKVNLRNILTILENDNVISKDDMNFLSEVIRIRNIIIHEGKIDRIPFHIDQKLQEITSSLEEKVGKYIIKESSYKKKNIFQQWIDDNVEDLDSAYELLQAVTFNERYGAYTAIRDGNKFIVRGPQDRKLYLNTNSDKHYFVKLLEERFSKDGMTIEEQYDFNQALAKDD